jgi:hypothetical protein
MTSLQAQDQGNRVKINLGATPWKFVKSDPPNAQSAGVNEGAWATVGLPHTWNENDIFINMPAGGPASNMGGIGWYRKHFTLDQKYADRKVFVEFEASHVGVQVYINEHMIKGNSKVNTSGAANQNATHVVGFLPFIVDITPYVQFGGTDNIMAVRVSGSEGFYQFPTFSIDFRFGQGCYGLWRPVWMYICDKVYIPANIYSVVNNWGTYVATVSAGDASATVRVMTHVMNESGAAQTVTLVTQIVDAANGTVATQTGTQAIDAGKDFVFDQTHNVSGPHLWYPAASPFGTPYLYKVYHIVKINGATVDVARSPLGIRVVTWDNNGQPVFNGHVHELWGVGSRYDYPALATAVPEEQQWRDAKICSEYGGRLWRPGHSTGSPELTAACDAYGIMLMQPSGELEGNFSTAQIKAGPDTMYKRILKSEVHRDMIVRDRNNPSVLSWEVSNGPIDATFERYLKDSIEKVWDPVHTRPMSDRGGSEGLANKVAEIFSCSSRGCASGFHTSNPTSPIWGAEEWDYNTRFYRWDYANELTLASVFVNNWLQYQKAKVFGFAHWYFSETPGETGLGRGFQESMFDHNRIPKLLAKVYRANWVPFAFKPVVHLANHWNRSGSVQVNAFSNCPKVRLLINGQQQGNPVVPSAGGGIMPSQCQWNVGWASGTLTAQGLDASDKVVCADSLVTAGNPDHILLTVEPPLIKPDGTKFQITANGSDAAFILATVVDAQGNWCPTASDNITFAVTGPANYRGGADGDVKPGDYTVHAPGDHELSAQGGYCKIAVRTTFETGTVTVNATSPNLGPGTASYTVVPAVVEMPIFDGPVGARFGATTHGAVWPECRIESDGRTIRYFISQPMSVSVEILGANGRLVRKIPGSRRTAGWHPVSLADRSHAGAIRGNGVYFVRLSAEGRNLAVKRVLLLRK